MKFDIFSKTKKSVKQDIDESLIFSPSEFVSGFVELTSKDDPVEVAWHAAAIALDTERIRLLYQTSDDGVYFIAADAAAFTQNPNAISPLAAALPNNVGHKGDGAYFLEVGRGLIAVVIKEVCGLRSYVGEHNEAMQFALNLPHFWVASDDAQEWVGCRQFESRAAQHIAKKVVIFGLAISAVCAIGAFSLIMATAALKKQNAHAVMTMRAQQEDVARILNTPNNDAYVQYVRFSKTVLDLGGVLTRFEIVDGQTKWEAQIPAVVTNLSELGDGLTTKIVGDRVVVTKGIAK